MGPTERIRSRSSRVLGATMVVMAALGLGSAVTGGSDTLLRFAAPVALFGVLGWAAFWQPYVEVSDGGVTLVNILRTVQVPWPAIDEVDGRYGLRLDTAYGVLTGWAAPAPSGKERSREQQSTTASSVTRRLASLRDAGFLEDRRLEAPRLRTTWHLPLLVMLAALGLGTVVLPFLA